MPDGEQPRRTTTRAGLPWRVLRRLALGALVCCVVVIVLFGGVAVLSFTGSSFDPHGYAAIFGTLLAVALMPLAIALWALYRSLRWTRDR
jgi:hypothetical protein